jgi:phosphoribosylglycinamide formyltransferase-1
MSAMKIGTLASHEGTTLQAVIDACEVGQIKATPAVVISNNSKSGAARRAVSHSIPFYHLSGKTHPEPGELDRAICQALEEHEVDLVLLAGYMKKLGPLTLKRFEGRVINTHPALLPKFGGQGMYGDRVYEAVLAAGETVTGVSVHVVDAEYDTGPVVTQREVPVLPDDDVESLSERVKAQEKPLLLETIRRLADGEIKLPTP